jgi:dienelactone hydrolase family protein
MENETKEEGLSRRDFLIGFGGGVLGAAALASGATPERKYIGANTSWVDFGEGTRAFLTQPQQGSAPFRAVILGHERYGLVQHTLDLAAKFAAYGYVCVAPDMASHWNGDKSALNRGEARLTLTPDKIKYYMGKGLDYLLAQPQVDKTRIAAMGCAKAVTIPCSSTARERKSLQTSFSTAVSIPEMKSLQT